MCVLSTTHDLFLLLKKPWHPPGLLLMGLLNTFNGIDTLSTESHGGSLVDPPTS